MKTTKIKLTPSQKMADRNAKKKVRSIARQIAKYGPTEIHDDGRRLWFSDLAVCPMLLEEVGDTISGPGATEMVIQLYEDFSRIVRDEYLRER